MRGWELGTQKKTNIIITWHQPRNVLTWEDRNSRNSGKQTEMTPNDKDDRPVPGPVVYLYRK